VNSFSDIVLIDEIQRRAPSAPVFYQCRWKAFTNIIYADATTADWIEAVRFKFCFMDVAAAKSRQALRVANIG
jgi:hypothetical protein